MSGWEALGLPSKFIPPRPGAHAGDRVVAESHGVDHDLGPGSEVVVGERRIHQDHAEERVIQEQHVHEEIVGEATEHVVAERHIHRDIPQQVQYRDVVHERVEHIPMTKMVPQTTMEQHEHREQVMVPTTHVHERTRHVPHTEYNTEVVQANQMMYVTDFHYERVPVVKRIPVTKHVNMRRRIVERVPVTHWSEETQMVPQTVAHKNPDHLHVQHPHSHHIHGHTHATAPIPAAPHHHHHGHMHGHNHAHVHHNPTHHHHVEMVPVTKRVPHTTYVEQVRFETKTVPETSYVEEHHWAVRRRPHTRARAHREAAQVVGARTHLHEVREAVPHTSMHAEERVSTHAVPVTKVCGGCFWSCVYLWMSSGGCPAFNGDALALLYLFLRGSLQMVPQTYQVAHVTKHVTRERVN